MSLHYVISRFLLVKSPWRQRAAAIAVNLSSGAWVLSVSVEQALEELLWSCLLAWEAWKLLRFQSYSPLNRKSLLSRLPHLLLFLPLVACWSWWAHKFPERQESVIEYQLGWGSSPFPVAWATQACVRGRRARGQNSQADPIPSLSLLGCPHAQLWPPGPPSTADDSGLAPSLDLNKPRGLSYMCVRQGAPPEMDGSCSFLHQNSPAISEHLLTCEPHTVPSSGHDCPHFTDKETANDWPKFPWLISDRDRIWTQDPKLCALSVSIMCSKQQSFVLTPSQFLPHLCPLLFT